MFAKHQIRVMSAILAATLSMSPSVQAVAGTGVSSNSGKYNSEYEETETGDIASETEEATEMTEEMREEATDSSATEESSETPADNESESTEESEPSESDEDVAEHKEETTSENEAVEDELPSEEVSENAADEQDKKDVSENAVDEQDEEEVSSNDAEEGDFSIMSVSSDSSESANSVSYNAYSGVETVPSRLNDGTLGMVRGQKWYTSTDGLETGNKKHIKINTKKGIVQASKPGTAEVGVGGRKYNVTVVDPVLSTKRVSIGVGENASAELKDKKSKESLESLGFKVAWETTNANVAQVVNGTIVGSGKGAAKVYAVVGGKIYSVSVRVKDKPSSEYLMNMPNKKSARNQVPQANKTSWSYEGDKISISEKSKATVNAKEQGLTIVQGNDNHKVWVYSNNPTVDTSYGISAVGKANKYTVRMIPGDKLLINLSESHELPIWKTNKPGIAVASEYGVIIAENKGTANLSARVGGKKVNVQVVVGDTRSYDYSTMDDSYLEKTVIDPLNGNNTVNIFIKRDGTFVIGDVAPKEYADIKFDSDGGTPVADARVKKGNTVSRPSEPVKEKNIFDGWDHAGVKWDFAQAVTDDMTLTAVWLADEDENGIPDMDEATVKFDSDGGTTIADARVKKGSTVSCPSAPTKTKNLFDGWNHAGEKWDFNQAVTDDMTLTASWLVDDDENGIPDKDEATVKFDTDGGSHIADARIKKGSTVSCPSAPTKAKNLFNGWSHAGEKWDFKQTVANDMTLTALWLADEDENGIPDKDEATVKFDTDGGSNIADARVKKGSTVSCPSAPTKAKNLFDGWNHEGKKWDFKLLVSDDMTLTAAWLADDDENGIPDKDEATVKFDSDGGSHVADARIKKGHLVTRPSDPTKAKNVFNGWNYAGFKWDFEQNVEDDMTLTASWLADEDGNGIPDSDEAEDPSQKIFTVIYDANGGKLGNGSEFGITETSESRIRADLIVPVREGYEFKGWHYQDNKKAWNPKDVITGNATLIAYWEKDGVIYGNDLPLVMFNDAHGGFFMRRANEDHTVTAPTPEWTNHAFQGWFYEDGTTEYASTDVFTETKILTAKWDDGQIGTYKDLVVTFNPDNGDEPTIVKVKTGAKVDELEEPWKDKFAFVGWYNGSVRYDFSDAVTRNITLTAKWVPATYMTVSFNSNGGTEISPVTVQSGNRIAKPEDPVRESDFHGDYEFRGWTLDGETFDFDTKIYKNFTLNAEWKKVFTVSFNSNTDDNIKFKSQRIDEGDHVNEPDSRKMKGHTHAKTFKHWENDEKFDFNEGVNDSFTLDGQWTKAFTMYKDGKEGNKILKALVDAEKGTYSQVKHYTNYNGIPEFLLSYDEDKLVNGIGTFDGVMVGVLSVPFGTNTPAVDEDVDTDVNTELFVWYNHAEHTFYWWTEAVGEKNGIWPGTNMDHLFDDFTGIVPGDLPFKSEYEYKLTYAPVSDSFAGSITNKNNYPKTDMTIAINNSDGTISKNVIKANYGATEEIKFPKNAKAVTLSLVLKEATDSYYTYKWHVIDENGKEIQTGGGQSILLKTLGNYTVYFTAEPMPAFFG